MLITLKHASYWNADADQNNYVHVGRLYNARESFALKFQAMADSGVNGSVTLGEMDWRKAEGILGMEVTQWGPGAKTQ